MVEQASQNPGATVWIKYGLTRSTISRGTEAALNGASPRETRFRQALEERGGLFTVFGRFLAGRADLLPSSYLLQLRAIKIPNESRASELSLRDLGSSVSDFHLIRVAPCSEVYGATYDGRRVVIELYGADASVFSEPAWTLFRREIHVLADGPESLVATPAAIDRFGDWLRLESDLGRKRTILGNLGDIPSDSISRFPALVPGLQSDRWLAYEAVTGRLLEDDLRLRPNPARKSLQRLTESLLEQCLLLSMVDADLEIGNFLLLDDGGIGFRALPAFAPVPVEWHYEFLQYVASTVAGETPRAIRMLSRMSGGGKPYAAEQVLLRNLSGLRPELKVRVTTPESVTGLENYWRAHAASGLNLPVFLELFHRQMTLVGQQHSEIGTPADLIEESLWPVLARVLKLRFSEILTVEKGREWMFGTGLLSMATVRQLGLSLEQLRDNELAVVLDQQETAPDEVSLRRRTGFVRSGVALGILVLSSFLAFSLKNKAAEIIAIAAMLISAAALSFFISRMD